MRQICCSPWREPRVQGLTRPRPRELPDWWRKHNLQHETNLVMACTPILPNVPQLSQAHVFNRPQLPPFSTQGGLASSPLLTRNPGSKRGTEVSPSSFSGHVVEELCKSLRLNWGPKGGSGAQAAVAFGLGVKYPQGVGRDKLPGRRGKTRGGESLSSAQCHSSGEYAWRLILPLPTLLI